MHVTRRASGLETRPDIARGIITRAFLVSRCCCSEFCCKACAFSFSDDIDDSCTRLRLWNSSLNVLRVVTTSPRLPPKSASRHRAQIAILPSPFRTLLPYLHHSPLRRSRRHRPPTQRWQGKSEFLGKGALVQLLAIGLFFVVAPFAGGLVAFILALILFVIGSSMSSSWICGACATSSQARTSKCVQHAETRLRSETA